MSSFCDTSPVALQLGTNISYTISFLMLEFKALLSISLLPLFTSTLNPSEFNIFNIFSSSIISP